MSEENKAAKVAKNVLNSIMKDYRRLYKAKEKNQDNIISKIRNTWTESVYSVEVRSGWHHPGDAAILTEFALMLAYGGPACRIYGFLDNYGNPETAYIQYQEHFASWKNLSPLTDEEQKALIAFSSSFHYGE